MFDSLAGDIRHAIRGLLARPSYVIVTVVTLALVIGASTAVLAVVNATMVRPLSYPDANRLVRLYMQPPGTYEIRHRNPLSPRVFVRFRSGGLQSLDAVEGFWARDRTIGGDGEPVSVPAALASAGALQLLGGPLLGRTWTEEEDRANARVAVISHGLWQRRFGGDDRILGKSVLIDREPHTIVGVMQPGFQAIYIEAELWTPLDPEGVIDNTSTFIQTVARLRPGTSVDQLHAEIGGAMARVVDEAPNALRGWGARAMGIREGQFALQRPALVVLLVAVAALTLIACANLANLTLAQVMARRAETALRAALGAARGRILRLQLVESLLLAAAGTIAGLLLGTIALPTLLALDPQTARTLGDVSIDWRVQSATTAIAVLVAVLAGVVPLLGELRKDVVRGLAESGRRLAGSRTGDRVRRVLVALEAALAVVLLACGTLLLSGFERNARTDPGFNAENVLGAQIRLPQSAYPNEASRTDVVTRILERVRGVPGVTSAATTLNLFVPGFTFQTLVHIEGRPTEDGQPHTVQFRRVSPEYFKTLRIPLERGRDFSPADGRDAPLVVIVSLDFAERFWSGQDPLGRRVLRNGPQQRPLTVVGVVGDVSDVGLGQASEPTLYVPFMQSNPVTAPTTTLVVRTAGDPLASAPLVRAAVLSVDSAQPIDHVTTLNGFLAESLGPQRFRSTLLLILAGLGLVIAAVGIYGVTTRAVEERTHEVGVRLALGARPGMVWRMVVRHALAAVAAGMLFGSVGAIAASSVLIAALPGLERAEPWSVVPAVLTLTAVSVLAAAVPAARAVKVHPMIALRGD